MSVEGLVNVPVSVDALARVLDRHQDFRVLRRMQPMNRAMPRGLDGALLRGVAIDVETTGLEHGKDRIVEFALQSFTCDREGRILGTGRNEGWLEDPGVPLTAEIQRVTGLKPEDLKGKRIHDGPASSAILQADFVVSHNCKFDRPFVDERLQVAGRAWACSLAEVDWKGLGFEGRSLSVLLAQMGWFYQAHRAGVDVTALLHLLDYELADGRTVLGHLLASARRKSYRLYATDAPYRAKDKLKERGWRWNAERRVWWTDVWEDERDPEEEWATIHVYSCLRSPDRVSVDWTTRYAT